MVAIGTVVIGNDGYSKRLGQIADHQTTRWGTFHVVATESGFEQVATIASVDDVATKIGWKIATPQEIERAMMWRRRELENAAAEAEG